MSWMTRIDQWMVTEVLKIISARKHPEHVYISVNLSAKSVSDPAFVSWLLTALDTEWTPNAALRFEITETEYLQTSQVEMRFFEELRRRGYHVSLDDFGSGYNSFNLLKRLKVDGIKIDSAFTRDLMRDPVDRALIEAIASIGRAMNIEVTAEGVEDEETYRILHKMGVGAFQGYLFHRAEPAGRAVARRYIH
jgi:EAL domain-containing protein (putative c-di-GMP-specific phosphodiesterase class I)